MNLIEDLRDVPVGAKKVAGIDIKHTKNALKFFNE